MAKSLNQAFIKAYRKTTESNTEPSATEVVDGFVLRFDTATVSIPEPHLLRERPAKRDRGPLKAKTDQEDRQDQQVQATRDAVVDQMVRSVDWQDSLGDSGVDLKDAPESDVSASPRRPAPASSESVGQPNQVGGESRSRSAGSKSQSDVALSLTTESVVVGGTVPEAPALPLEVVRQLPPEGPNDPPEPPAQRELEKVTSPAESSPAEIPVVNSASNDPAEAVVQSDEVETTQPSRGKSHERVKADQQVEHSNRDHSNQDHSNNDSEPQPAQLQSPSSSALSPDEVERIVANYVQKHGKQGEIFRLDRPTYDATANPSRDSRDVEEVADESGVESSIDEAPSITEYDVKISEARREATRAVEQGLREARTQSFHPQWEVDRFQWPLVCEELLQSNEESMMRVARNLATACDEGLQVLAVTSPQSGEGRTTVACCLARLAAISGLKVAFVDGDIENPTVVYQANLDVEADWHSAVVQQTPLEEIAVSSIEDQLVMIPLLDPVAAHEFASNDNRIALMFQRLTQSFDLVIADMGHMQSPRSLVTGMAEAGIVNAVATVVDRRTSSPKQIEDCIRRIRHSGIASIGLVENFAA